MPLPDRYTRGWKRPVIYDSDRATERALEHNIRTTSGRASMAMDALGVANDLGNLAKYYDETRLGMEKQQILADLKGQLAPNQQVRVAIDPKTNAVREIARPGAGYLRQPGERDENGVMIEKVEYFPLEGDDDGICRTKVRPDTTDFTVPDKEGKRRRIKLFEDNGPIEKDSYPDDDSEPHRYQKPKNEQMR